MGVDIGSCDDVRAKSSLFSMPGLVDTVRAPKRCLPIIQRGAPSCMHYRLRDESPIVRPVKNVERCARTAPNSACGRRYGALTLAHQLKAQRRRGNR
jgi:hypothetical protein